MSRKKERVLTLIMLAAIVLFACNQPTSSKHEHQWGEWGVTTPATCVATGVETRTCTLDATHTETRTIPIDPNAHQWGNIIVHTQPTCTEDGDESAICQLCNIHDDHVPIAALGHDFGEWIAEMPIISITEVEVTRTCSHDPEHAEANTVTLSVYLYRLPLNTTDTPYTIVMNVSSLPTGSTSPASYSALQRVFSSMPIKYVNLDLSASTFTSIEDDTFSNCTRLTSITIPDSVTSIGNVAFNDCTNLASITIPTSVTSIGQWAFNNCTSLESITIPDGVTSIGQYVFFGCTSLESITIPDGVTSIGNDAFPFCTSLESITIPDSVTSIGGGAFYGCTNLASIIFGSTGITFGNSWGREPFMGDLQDKYLAGGIGTYTTPAPVTDESVWTKQ